MTSFVPTTSSLLNQRNSTPTSFGFWSMSVINSFLLMRHFGASTQSKLSQIKHFRVKLAEGLTGDYNSRHKYSLPSKVWEVAKQPGCKPPSFSQARESTRVASGGLQVWEGHFPVKVDATTTGTTTTIVDTTQLCTAKSVAMLSVLCLGTTMMDQHALNPITASTYTDIVIT